MKGQSNPEVPNPGHLLEEFQAYQRSLALRTALELDLFTHIDAGAETAGALAIECRAAERGIRILCDYLTVTGHLLKQSDTYRLTLNSALYLSKASAAYIGSAAGYLAGDAAIHSFVNLTQAVRNGGRVVRDDEPLDTSEWIRFAESMASLAAPVAAFAAAAVKLDRDGPLKILDIAAGHGHYGLAIAALCPHAHVFALDRRDVLEIAARNARLAGAGERYHPIPADAFQVDFGGPYDMIVVANFAHHLDEATNTTLFRKCLAALKPSGQLLVIDFVPDDDRISPAPDAAFALTMLATTAHGDVYSFRDFTRMLRNAGFRDVRQPDVGDLPHWIITASA